MFRVSCNAGVACITLSRPPVNAISERWVEEFHKQLNKLEASSDCSVLHIRSDQKVFCAGADLKVMAERFPEPDSPHMAVEAARSYQYLFNRIESLGAVTLVELGGAAVGGGLELALACDLRIAGETVKVGLPEVALGLLPGAGGTQRLTRLVGPGLAKRLILGAEVLQGREAAELGLVQWAVPISELEQRARELAVRFAKLPRHAVAAAKSCIAAALDPARNGYDEELKLTESLLESSETRQLVEQFLRDRRI